MKPALLITLSFLLFAFTFPTKLASAAKQVLDTNDDPIIPGDQYFILPFVWGPLGGGVRLGKTDNSTCPVTVVQEPSDLQRGFPVKFEIPCVSTGIISTDTPLQISFAKKPNCADSAKWVLVTDESGESWVGIGDPEDHPGHELVSGDFKIVKVWWWYYKLVFCPKSNGVFGAPRGNGEACFNIGRLAHEGGSRLGVTDHPLYVVFVKADPIATSII